MLQFSIVGMSEGNGHPYSWSAICNGYDKNMMENCGFPVIPRYLECEKFPENFISDRAKVVSIWTQDRQLSRNISNTCFIKDVCYNLDEASSGIDGILYARDDAENHYKYLEPLIKSNKPIYVDKPIAHRVNDLDRLLGLTIYDYQLFTCSALSFSQRWEICQSFIEELYEDFIVYAEAPKSWEKYSIHIIEPVLNIIPDDLSDIRCVERKSINNMTSVSLKYDRNISLIFTTTGSGSGKIKYIIKTRTRIIEIVPDDTFNCFKNAILKFCDGIEKKSKMLDYERVKKIVSIIEIGVKN